MKPSNIAVIFPSRGLAFSKTCEELLDNLEEHDYKLYFAHGKSIPHCFNIPLEQALRNRIHTHFWFVEDDMILPAGVLNDMLAMHEPAVACDYPVTEDGTSATCIDPDGTVLYSGTGCLLVTRAFINAYKRPVFRSDVRWQLRVTEGVELRPERSTGDVYGMHDVNFGLLAYMRGKPIKLCQTKCGQRKLLALGKPGTNNGAHNIMDWTKTKPATFFGVKLGDLSNKEENRNVVLKDGTETFMTLTRAKELEKVGKVTIPPKRYISFENNELLEKLT